MQVLMITILLVNDNTSKYNIIMTYETDNDDYNIPSQIKGLQEALAMPGSGVACNYSATTVTKTFEYLQSFQGGHALFTFPPLPIKCPGAPQKIMYIADEYFRKVSIM